jgi:hypothetical protein
MAGVFNANTAGSEVSVRQDGNSVGNNLAAMTYAVWFKVTADDNTSTREIVQKGAARWGLRLNASTNSVDMLIRDTSTGRTLVPGSYTLDQWHLAVLTYAAGTPSEVHAYLDPSGATPTPDASNTSDLNGNTISDANGVRIGPDGSGLDVTVYEVCVWDKVLSAAEIGALGAGTVTDQSVSLADRILHFDFSQNIAGDITVSPLDASLNDLSATDSDLDRSLTGSPVYSASDPFDSPAPVISLSSLNGLTNETVGEESLISSADTVDLGTVPLDWPDGSSSVLVGFSIENIGDATLSNVGVSVSGSDATLVTPTGTVSAIESSGTQAVEITLTAATAGAKTTTVTIESDELSDFTFTLNWHVREDSNRTVTPGAGFSSPPTQSDTQVGSGDVTERVAAHADVADLLWVEGSTLDVFVAADHCHIGWIQRVEVYFESDTVSKTLYTPSISPSSRSGAVGFGFTLDVSAESAGDYAFYVKVIPVEGLERQLGPFSITFDTDGSLLGTAYHLDPAGDDANDGSDGNPVQTVAQALALCSSEGDYVICDAAGTYDSTASSVSDPDRNSSRVHRVILADGLAYGDVIFGLPSGRSSVDYRTRKVQFEDIKWDTETVGRIASQGSDAGTGFNAINYVRCGWVDATNGGGGPRYGYYDLGSSGDTEYFPTSFTESANSRQAHYETRECVGLTGITGVSLIAGGHAGAMLMPSHGGDNSFGNTAVFNMGFSETAQRAFTRYSTEETLTVASSSYDGVGDKTTVTLSGSATLRDTTGGDTVDSLTKLFLLDGNGDIADDSWSVPTANSIDATAKTIIVTGDATSVFTNGVSVFLAGALHSDCWQFNLTDGENNYVYNRGVWNMGSRSQPALVQIPSGTGTISAVAMQLVANTGTNFGRWEETYSNAVFRQVSWPGAYHSMSGDFAASLMIHSSSADPATFTQAGVVLDPTGQDEDLYPTLNGDLLAEPIYLPRLPVDVYGIAVPRDGSAASGAVQYAVSVVSTVTGTDGAQAFRINFSAAVSYTLGNGPSVRLYRSAENDRQSATLFGSPIVIPASASGITSLTCTLSTGTLDADLFYWVDLDTSGSDMDRDSDSAPVASFTDEPMTVSGGGGASGTTVSRSFRRARGRSFAKRAR